MSFLAAADEQRNHQEATSPKNNETANMVTMGIDILQQLVHQPPSDYASTDRDKESALAATDSKISEDTRCRPRGRKKEGRGSGSGTVAAHPQHHQVVPNQYNAADRGQEKAAAGSLKNGI